MKAIGNQVIVKTDMFPDKIENIIVPEKAKWQRTNCGTVVAIGDKHYEVKVGDRVVYSKYHGTEFKIDGVRYLLLEDDEVLCRVDE